MEDTLHKLCIFFMTWALCAVTGYGQTQASTVVGEWQGTLSAGGAELTIVIHLEQTETGLSATIDSPDQGVTGIPVDSATLDGDTLVLKIGRIGGQYTATVSKGAIQGEWQQAGQSSPLNLVPASQLANEKNAPVVSQAEAAKVVGSWHGELSVGPNNLRLVFNIKHNDDGALSATMDSLDQSAMGIPVKKVVLDGDQVTLTLPGIGAQYAATLHGETMRGTWRQGPSELPLDLKRGEPAAPPKRPQEPKPPFPYDVETVQFTNQAADVQLAGTLTLPKGDGPFPAAVLVTGSGPQDRDESLMGHKPFWILADYLTRAGIAVLRYDDRGFGDSTGDFQTATSMDFTEDANAAVNYLSTRPEVDSQAIGIIGHSEGGLIAPIAANRNESVAYAVLMAGPGLPGDEILVMQSALISRANGEEDTTITRDLEILKQAIALVKEHGKNNDFDTHMDDFLQTTWDRLSDEEQAQLGNDFETLKAQFQPLRSPWFYTFMTYDPRSELEQLTIPVLAINGEKDLQVPPAENLAAIDKALQKAGNQHYRIVEVPGLNHLFQHAESGSPNEYAQIEETFAEKAMKIIADWILQHTTP